MGFLFAQMRLEWKWMMRSLFILLGTGCNSEEMEKIWIYQYKELITNVKPDSLTPEGIPRSTAINFSCDISLTTENLRDTMVFINRRRAFGCAKDEVPSPILEDPIAQTHVFSTRSFGPAFPPGQYLDPFFYVETNGLPRPFSSSVQNPSRKVFLVGAPDTLKGLTRFIWKWETQKGRVLWDTTTKFF